MIAGVGRWRAFSIHLLISALIFFVVLGVILWFWYPGLYINMGGWEGISIIAGVDLILGPLLTLIVFNPAKKSLKFDLAVVALIQAAGLSYGIWAVESQRVAAQVLLDDKLFVLSKAEISKAGYAISDINDRFGEVPPLVFMDLPEDRQEIINFVATAELFKGLPAAQMDYYLPFNAVGDNANLKDRLIWRFSRLDFDEDNACYWLPVESGHYKGDACLTQEGIVSLR